MFPMISGLQELLDAITLLEEVKKELDEENLPYDPNLKVGIMIEVPSAVAIADLLARHVDFFSIGTNDLIQYALAVDRVNEYVTALYHPFHPAILRMIHQVVSAAEKAGIGLSLCGEMAGDPLCVPILLGLGIEELSMNARAIPLDKQIIRSISFKEAQIIYENLMSLNTAKGVKGYILQEMRRLVPELADKGYLEG